MSSLFTLLGFARSGLQAQTTGIATTGQNIAHVNTPGHVRRSALLAARFGAGGSVGGMEFIGIQRSFERLTHARLVREEGRRGAAESRADALAALEAAIAPGRPTLADHASALFAAFNALSAFPMDPAVRAEVLRRSEDLAQQSSATATELGTAREALYTRARSVAGEVNEGLGRIATLHRAIAEASARGDAGDALRDERDRLVLEVGGRIGARAVEDDSGALTLFTAGTALVEGGRANSVGVDLDGGGSLRVRVHRPGGSSVEVTAAVNEGSLGGIREARDVDLPRALEDLDRFAHDLARAVNTAHAAGVGLDGAGERKLFATTATAPGAARALRVDPAVAGRPERIAAASRPAELPAGNGTALRITSLASQPLAGGGTPAQRAGAVAAEVGSRRASAEAERQLRTETLSQVHYLQESISNVSIDEEMMNLTRFQRAFEVSTKVLRTADELLDQLTKSR